MRAGGGGGSWACAVRGNPACCECAQRGVMYNVVSESRGQQVPVRGCVIVQPLAPEARLHLSHPHMHTVLQSSAPHSRARHEPVVVPGQVERLWWATSHILCGCVVPRAVVLSLGSARRSGGVEAVLGWDVQGALSDSECLCCSCHPALYRMSVAWPVLPRCCMSCVGCLGCRCAADVAAHAMRQRAVSLWGLELTQLGGTPGHCQWWVEVDQACGSSVTQSMRAPGSLATHVKGTGKALACVVSFCVMSQRLSLSD